MLYYRSLFWRSLFFQPSHDLQTSVKFEIIKLLQFLVIVFVTVYDIKYQTRSNECFVVAMLHDVIHLAKIKVIHLAKMRVFGALPAH